MYYILKISNEAFMKLEENHDVIIVKDPERATKIEKIGDAMRHAAQLNEDWEEAITQVVRVG